MTRTKVIISVAFVLAMGAGVAVGMLSSRSLPQRGGGLISGGPGGPGGPGGSRASWLIEELQLTAEQQKKMDELWTPLVRTKMREYGEEFRALQQQHAAAVTGIFS